MRVFRAIYTIWLRDVLKFFRERYRMMGILAQPVLFLALIGTGLSTAFHMPLAPEGFDYLMFMYPGIVAMAVLFTGIFSGLSVVWDKEFGFLKEVLVAPVPRWTVAVGKAMGGSTVAMSQGVILLIIAPIIGIHLPIPAVLKLTLILFLIAFAVTSMGITIASRMESTEGFQMIVNFLVLPLFFLSGAVFPLLGVAIWIEYLMMINPLTYGVDALRNVMYAGTPAEENFVHFPLAMDLLVIGGLAVIFILIAAMAFNKQD